jgi:hypothetical protein
MSPPPFAPGVPPRPVAAPRPAAPRPKRLRWTWLERFLIALVFIPAFLFVPGIAPVRVLIRMAVFLLPMGIWFAIVQSGRGRAGGALSAGGWLKVVAGWLGLMIVHWGTRSLPAALAQATFYIAVFSPVFWVPKVLASPRQLGRLMTILLVCNAVSSSLGLAQVFRPATFNPPVIPGVTDAPEDSVVFLSLTYTDQNGRRIIRPCGLGDTPGGAAMAGAAVVMTGLAFSLRRVGMLRRLASLGAAFCGMAVIYYSQIRMIFLMEVICLAVLAGVFALQRDFARATLLSGLGAAMVVGALSWVMATSGQVVVERFLGLATNDFGGVYRGSGRALYVEHALSAQMWEEPLGMGLGRWGTVSGIFGAGGDGIWVEVMIPGWLADGGIPLLVLYVLALAAAMIDTLRIALTSRDKEIRFWAAVVFASNLSVIATCFSFVTFITVIGMQFWFLAAVVHAADYQARREAAAQARAALAAARPAPPGPPRPAAPPYPTAPA